MRKSNHHETRPAGKYSSGLLACVVISATLFGVAAQAQTVPQVTDYHGLCDASAAVALGIGRFIVASDEDNLLRLYRQGQPEPFQTFAMDDFTKPDYDNPELDIEAAAAIGNRIYWITSHGANKNAKPRPSRHRLFATEINFNAAKPVVVPVGRPYLDLAEDLAQAPGLKKFKLGDAASLAPKEEGGLNIEGLASTPEGALLIGFRNPIPGGNALLVTIENPNDIIQGKKAKLGEPIELPLDNLGIRSIEAVGKSYLIVAGPYNNDGTFKLFRWPGIKSRTPELLRHIDFGDMHPEALFITATGEIQILSDDGGLILEDQKCKDAPQELQRFRSLRITP